MSKWVVLVPGIMGSSLLLRTKEVWPPSIWDVMTGYDQIDDLMSDDVEVGSVIRAVSIRPVYRSLVDDIERCGYHETDLDRRLIEFPYDWRLSNSITAERLAVSLDKCAGDALPEDITFVAHSMGGLVVRRLLEGGQYEQRPWFPAIRRLITLGTPHFGAPLALARLQGDEKVLGVSGADIRKLASDERYPSSYELVGPGDNAFVLDMPPRGIMPQALNRFGTEYTSALRLERHNIQQADEFWSHLDLAKRPSGVQYFFVGGAAHKTTAACTTDGMKLFRTIAESSGDGTVPVASAIVRSFPHLFSRKDHVRIFEDRTAREALYDLLDAPGGVHPQAAVEGQPVGEPGAIGLSVDQADYIVDEPIEIVVSYATPISASVESLSLNRLHEVTANEPIDAIDIALNAPRISNFVVTIHPHLDPGVYQLIATRDTDDPEPTIFRVLPA